MTSGQKAVWAAVYAAQRGLGRSVVDSVQRAAMEVKNLGTLQTDAHSKLLGDDEDAKVMLNDMLGVPR